MPADAPLTTSGKYGKGTVGATAIPHFSWEITEEADDLDATTAEDGGYTVGDAGCKGITFTVRGYIFANSAFAAVPGTIYTSSGTAGYPLTLWCWKDGATYYDGFKYLIPNWVCLAYNPKAEVRGKVEFELRGKSRGSYTQLGFTSPVTTPFPTAST